MRSCCATFQTRKPIQLLGFTVHDLGRPSAAFGLTRWAQARALTRALSAHGPFDLIHGLWGDPAGQLAARARAAWHSKPRHDGQRRIRVDSRDRLRIAADGAGPKGHSGSMRRARIHVCTQFMAQSGRPAWRPSDGDTAHVRHDPPRQDARPRSIARRHVTLSRSQASAASRTSGCSSMRWRWSGDPIDAHLDLVGEDTLGGELQRHAMEKGVADHVPFLGFPPQNRLAAIFADCRSLRAVVAA